MSNPLSIDELKTQKRWVLWRLVKVEGKDRLTKVPYQTNGRKASDTNPNTWATYSECASVQFGFDGGVGIVLGNGVWGVDLDECCDAATGKFTPESREIVIGLDSYSEFSPSGTGCHILGAGKLPGPGTKKPWPGCKAIEIYDRARYFTFTGRRLTKTPAGVLSRQTQIESLYHRVKGATRASLVLTARPDEDARFAKLWAGDKSGHKDDASAADLALCCILARRLNNNFYKIDDEFRKSGLYRDKWEREDYRVRTILKAIGAGQAAVFNDTEEPIEDDGIDKWVVEPLDNRDGWFPAREISLIGGGSGSGKTYWTMTLLEQARIGAGFLGHKTIPRDYRVLMHDRGVGAMRRTLAALGLSDAAKERVVRLSPKQQAHQPAEVLEALAEVNPGIEVWFIEGLDFWFPDVLKMNIVGPILDALHRVATRRNIAVIATVGAPKEKTIEGKATARYYGRDALFGSAALARKVDTVALISKTDMDDENAPRQYTICKRNGGQERFWMAFADDRLTQVDKPEPKEREPTGPPSKAGLLRLNIRAQFKPGERIKYTDSLGVHLKTFYNYMEQFLAEGWVEKDGGRYIMGTE